MTSCRTRVKTEFDFIDDVGSSRERLVRFAGSLVTLSKAKVSFVSEILRLRLRMTPEKTRSIRPDMPDDPRSFSHKEV
jgi:hypothetical protein